MRTARIIHFTVFILRKRSGNRSRSSYGVAANMGYVVSLNSYLFHIFKEVEAVRNMGIPPLSDSRTSTLKGKPQSELDLSGRTCRLADLSKPASEHRVGRQPEIHDVEDVEELRAKLHHPPLAVPAPAKWRVLDQRNVELMKARTSKRVAS